MSRSPSPQLDPIAVSEELAPLPSLKQAGSDTIDFDGQLDRPLKYHQDVRAGCGGQMWPAGLVLAKHMLRYRRREIQDATMCVEFFSCSSLPSPPVYRSAPA